MRPLEQTYHQVTIGRAESPPTISATSVLILLGLWERLARKKGDGQNGPKVLSWSFDDQQSDQFWWSTDDQLLCNQHVSVFSVERVAVQKQWLCLASGVFKSHFLDWFESSVMSQFACCWTHIKGQSVCPYMPPEWFQLTLFCRRRNDVSFLNKYWASDHVSAGLLEIIKHSQLGRKIEGGFLQRKQQRARGGALY